MNIKELIAKGETIQNLIENRYISNPRNKIVADCFKDIGFIEKYGSGIRRILQYFKDAVLPSPEFANISGGFMVTVFSKMSADENLNIGTDQKTAQKTAQKQSLPSTQEQILALLTENPKLTKEELMSILNKSDGTIKEHIAKLKEKGVLKRVGGRKSGHWEIIGK